MKITAKRLKERWGARSFDQGGRYFLIEGSGGINEGTVDKYFCDGEATKARSHSRNESNLVKWPLNCLDIDVLSLGSLTQGVPHIDFSLKVSFILFRDGYEIVLTNEFTIFRSKWASRITKTWESPKRLHSRGNRMSSLGPVRAIRGCWTESEQRDIPRHCIMSLTALWEKEVYNLELCHAILPLQPTGSWNFLCAVKR